MTVFIDPTENSKGSLFPGFAGAQEVPFLEELTGADFMVSLEPMPATTEKLVLEHIKRGALLVQRKSGGDIVSSVGTRLNMSLAKMRATGAMQSQCILLYDVEFTDPVITHIDFEVEHVLAAIYKWNSRGGVSEFVIKASDIPAWIETKMRHMAEFKKEPVKYVYPDKPEITEIQGALQLPVAVSDGRITLATFPKMGVKRANDLWSKYKNLTSCIMYLVDPDMQKDNPVSGIGAGITQAVREYFGLDDISIISIDISNTLLQKAEKERSKNG